MENPLPLAQFVRTLTALVESGHGEAALLEGARAAMRSLVARDDWLPAAAAVPHPKHYAQHLLFLDPAERFSGRARGWRLGQRARLWRQHRQDRAAHV